MISRITFCSAQPATMRAARLGPIPVDLAQSFRLLFDQFEHRVTERPDQLPGVDRTDAADHARAQIPLDALQRGRRAGLQEGGLELQPVGAIVDPCAAHLHPFAGGDGGGMPDHGDQVALATRLDPQARRSRSPRYGTSPAPPARPAPPSWTFWTGAATVMFCTGWAGSAAGNAWGLRLRQVMNPEDAGDDTGLCPHVVTLTRTGRRTLSHPGRP